MSERESTKERFKITPAVYIVLLNGNSEVYLMRRYQTGYEDGNYGLPSGHVEKEELPSNTAAKELKEETGVVVPKTGFLKPTHIMYRLREPDSGRGDLFYVVKYWEGRPEIKEPDKCDQAGWYPIDELPENTIPYIKFALDQIRNSPDHMTWSEYEGR